MQTFYSLPRTIATKSDIKKIIFDKEQVRIYTKIKDAKSSLESNIL